MVAIFDSGEKPWRDEAVLRELYYNKNMTMAEVADELGCGEGTVNRHIHKFDMEVNKIGSKNECIRNVDVVKLYWDEGMSQAEIAEHCDCSVALVSKEMSRRNVPVRGRYDKLPRVRTRKPDGHEFIYTRVCGEKIYLQLHRLLAVAEWGMESVSGKVCHHVNGIPWDNRVENIELVERGEHTRIHNQERDYESVERDEKGRLVSF